jgi:hypothetical protein
MLAHPPLTLPVGEARHQEARRAVATPTTSTPRPDHGIMAAPTVQLTTRASEYGLDIDIQSIATLSDYGSDIDVDEDTILGDAFDTLRDAAPSQKSAVLPASNLKKASLKTKNKMWTASCRYTGLRCCAWQRVGGVMSWMCSGTYTARLDGNGQRWKSSTTRDRGAHGVVCLEPHDTKTLA